jgi:hypothetical protein
MKGLMMDGQHLPLVYMLLCMIFGASSEMKAERKKQILSRRVGYSRVAAWCFAMDSSSAIYIYLMNLIYQHWDQVSSILRWESDTRLLGEG